MNIRQVEEYLCSLLRQPVTVRGLAPLGHGPGETEVKGYGYGTPVRVDYETAEGEKRSAVIHTMESGPFGHEHMADRAQILLWEHRAFNSLPRHVRALDVAGFDCAGGLNSLGNVEEFCLLTEYAEGEGYFRDLRANTGDRGGHGSRFRPHRRSLRLPRRDSPEAGESAGAVYSAHPRTGGTWGVHHGTGRFLSVAPGDYA